MQPSSTQGQSLRSVASRPFTFGLRTLALNCPLFPPSPIWRASWLRLKIFSEFMNAETLSVRQMPARGGNYERLYSAPNADANIQGHFGLRIEHGVPPHPPPPSTSVSRITTTRRTGTACTRDLVLSPAPSLASSATSSKSLNLSERKCPRSEWKE